MAAFLNEMKSAKLRKTGSLMSIRTGTEADFPERETTAVTLKRRLSVCGIEAGNKRQRTDDSGSGLSRAFVETRAYVFANFTLQSPLSRIGG